MRTRTPARRIGVDLASLASLASLALALAAASVAVPGSTAASASPERLPRGIVPVSQDIRLRLDPREAAYSGKVDIRIEVREESAAIRLHAEKMDITSARLRGGGADVTLRDERLADDLIALRADESFRPGSYELVIEFTGPFDTQAVGLYRMDRAGESYAFTQFEADDARKAFPAWDEPEFKIPFRITLTIPEGYLAISNTPEEKSETHDGWRTVRFRETKPLPTYLLAIAVGHFETIPIPGLSVPGRIVTPVGQIGMAAAAAQVTPDVIVALEEWFGSPYPYEKLDLIAVPEFWPGAMEHPGAITFRDTALLLDPAAASVAQHRTLARFTAHELAHQWFGNLVTMEWWDDLWLNEAFADWMGDKITQKLYPQFGVAANQLELTQGVMTGDARSAAFPIRREVVPGGSLMDGVGQTYLKGKLVLGMFEEWVGPESFRRGVQRYLEKNAWGNATAGDLWAALDETSGRDLSGALRGFIEQPGLPRIEAERLGGGRVRLSQHRFLNSGVEAEDLTWKIPVVLQYGDAGGTKRRTILLDEREKVVELPTEGEIAWLHPNGGARGYYRWSMPGRDLATLARVSPEVLTIEERMEFLGNAEALLDAGGIGADEYLGALNGFAGDPSPELTRSLMSGLEKIHGTFRSPELDDEIALFGRRVLGPALDRIGIEPRAGEPETVALLRPQLVGTLGDWCGDEAVATRARELAASYLADPSSVEPGLVGNVLWLAARTGDVSLWETYRERFEAATVPVDRSRFLGAMGGFRDPVARERALAFVFEGPLQTQEIFTIPQAMNDGDETADRLLDWAMDHYDDFAARLPESTLAFLVYGGGGCSRERLAKALAFYSMPEHRVNGTERHMERVRASVNDCAGLREREGEAAARWLRAYAAAGGGATGPAGAPTTSSP